MESQTTAKISKGDSPKISSHTSKPAPSKRISAHPILQLRQNIGNHAFGQFIQAKLRIGRQGDIYEKEADRVADQVMRMPTPGIQRKEEDEESIQTKPLANQITPLIRRQAGPDQEEEEESLQTKPLTSHIDPLIQRQAEPEKEEEESVQTKLLTGSFVSLIQRQVEPEEEEEEPVQAKSLTDRLSPLVQRQAESEEEEVEEPIQTKSLSGAKTPIVQRQTEAEREEEKEEEGAVQTKPISSQVSISIQRQVDSEEEEENSVQTKRNEDSDSSHRVSMITSASQAIRTKGPGEPMNPGIRKVLEPQIGVDLGDIRIHQDSTAQEATAALKAKAFTHGKGIWLGQGQSQNDLRLMAHETTHVVQQNEGIKRDTAIRSTVGSTAATSPGIVQRQDFLGALKEKSANFFWGQLERLAPNLVPILREISKKGIIGFLYSKLSGAFTRIFRKLENKGGVIGSLVKNFKSLLADVPAIIEAFRSGDCKALFAAIKQLSQKLKQMAGEAWEAIIDFFTPIGKFFSDLWNSYGMPVVDWLKETAGDIWEYIKNLGARIWKWTDPVRKKLGAAWDWVKEQLGIGDKEDSEGGLIDWVKAKAGEAWERVKQGLHVVIKPIQVAVEKIKAILPMDKIKNLRKRLQRWLNKVGAMAAKMGKPDGVAEEQVSLRDEILPAVLRRIRALRASLIGAGQWVAEQVGSVATSIRSFMENLRENPVLSVAGRAIQWLQSGVTQLADWAKTSVVNLFTLVGDGLVRLSKFVEPVLKMLQRVVEVLGDLAGKLPDLVLGPLWRAIPICVRNPIINFLVNNILKKIPIFAQILEIPEIWPRIKKTALRILKKVFVDGDLFGAAWTFFSELLKVLNVPPELVTEILSKAVKAFGDILNDPLGFLKNILGAIKQGFVQFGENIWAHLISGFKNWIFGAAVRAGIQPPEDLSLRSVFKFILEVLDITVDRVLERLEKKIGPEKVAVIRRGLNVIEKVWGWMSTLLNEGPGGVWKKLKEKLGNLWQTLLDNVIGYIVGKVTKAAIAKISTALAGGPFTAVIQGIITIYKAIQSFAKYLKQMLEIVNSVLDTVSDIAQGSIASAANMLESAMARAIPVMLGFLANQLGLGDISERIKEVLEVVRGKVNEALDWLIDKALKAGGAVLRWLKKGVSRVKELIFPKMKFKVGKESHTIMAVKSGTVHDILIQTRQYKVDAFIRAAENNNPNANEKKEIQKLKTAYDKWKQMKEDTEQQRGKKERAYSDIAKLIISLMKTGLLRDLHESKIRWSAEKAFETTKERATEVVADPLTKKPPSTGEQGSPPKAGEEPPGWNTDRELSFIRAHLLHGKDDRPDLHGPGKAKNLTPTSNSTNQLMYNRVERFALDAVHKKRRELRYVTKVKYDNNALPKWKRNVAKHMETIARDKETGAIIGAFSRDNY